MLVAVLHHILSLRREVGRVAVERTELIAVSSMHLVVAMWSIAQAILIAPARKASINRIAEEGQKLRGMPPHLNNLQLLRTSVLCGAGTCSVIGPV